MYLTSEIIEGHWLVLKFNSIVGEDGVDWIEEDRPHDYLQLLKIADKLEQLFGYVDPEE